MNKEAIISKAAGAFNKVRPGLAPGERFFLLRRAGETSRFSVVFEVEQGFWSRWSEYRERSIFMWADNSAEWPDRVAQTTHIAYGVPDENGRLPVFQIGDDQRDRLTPAGANLFWKLFGVRDPAVRFTVPDDETP